MIRLSQSRRFGRGFWASSLGVSLGPRIRYWAYTALLTQQFFALRFPSIYVGSVVVQLISYPCGRALAKWLPSRIFRIGKYEFTLNPGPFNQKEHMLITVLAGTTLGGTYSSDLFVTQISPVFFNQSWARSLTYQYVITISMQFLGYGLAGLARSCLVYPDFCLWPGSLSVIVLNRSLHESNGYTFKLLGFVFTRYRYFLAIFGLIIIWTM